MNLKKNLLITFVILLAATAFAGAASGQSKPEVLTGDALKRIVPTSFYFAGQSAETQMRNAAAAKLGENRHFLVGLVDTSGYSTEISGVYEGFLITDSAIVIGNKTLPSGAYGFGFSKEAVNVFDLSAKKILSVPVRQDADMKRPRPLQIVGEDKGIRLYKGNIYVAIRAK